VTKFNQPVLKSGLLAAGLIASGLSQTAFAESADDGPLFYLNFGVTEIDLSSSSGEIELSELDFATSLALNEGPVDGSGIALTGDTQPTINIGYNFKKMPGVSFETALGLPFVFDLTFTGTAASESFAPEVFGILPTGIPALGTELGNYTVLPAVASVVYTAPEFWRVRPHVGFGFTYILPVDSEVTNKVLTEVGKPKLDVPVAFGELLQVGFSARVASGVSLVADYKYVPSIEVISQLENIEVESNFSALPGIGNNKIGQGEVETVIDSSVFNIALKVEF